MTGIEEAVSLNLLISSVLLLLLLASAVAVVAKQMHIPYTVGLVLLGLAIAFYTDAAGVRVELTEGLAGYR